MAKKQLYDYDFKATSLSDFEMSISFEAKDKLLKKILKKSLWVFRRKTGRSATPEDVIREEFDIPSQYFNVLKTMSGSFIKGVEEELHPDGVAIMNYKVVGAHFKKQNNASENWTITLKFEGMYRKE